METLPIVVDAHYVVNDTRSLLPKLCHRVGIDPAEIQYDWEPMQKDQWPADPCMQEFYKEILRSSEVNMPSNANVTSFPSMLTSFSVLCVC